MNPSNMFSSFDALFERAVGEFQSAMPVADVADAFATPVKLEPSDEVNSEPPPIAKFVQSLWKATQYKIVVNVSTYWHSLLS